MNLSVLIGHQHYMNFIPVLEKHELKVNLTRLPLPKPLFTIENVFYVDDHIKIIQRLIKEGGNHFFSYRSHIEIKFNLKNLLFFPIKKYFCICT